VGTGFSYSRDPRGFCKSDKEIADQLVIFLKGFLIKYPVFETMPFWIFSESYGGKMTANFGVELHRAISRKEITINFKGVALGDSWIDPVGCMYSYPPFLQSISIIDEVQAKNLTAYAELAELALDAGLGTNATNWWSIQQDFAEEFTQNVNFYNFEHYDDYLPEDQLNDIMAGLIRQKLKIIPAGVTWGGQSGEVFDYMSGDFMTPAFKEVDMLLAAGYQVAVYSGQLDIIVDVICIDKWIQKLKWPGLYSFLNAPRTPYYTSSGAVTGYSKTYQNFSLFNVLKAGHMVPYDNGGMAYIMFETVTGQIENFNKLN